MVKHRLLSGDDSISRSLDNLIEPSMPTLLVQEDFWRA
jgi:hypothetical protein